ncbi:MAG: protoporphyrinogen oxidase HemJ [Pseudomonadales bacterium]
MLWLKAFHIIFVVSWFAGLFYLPRLFVYHAMATEQNTRETLQVMERKLMIMTHIGAALSWLSGILLVYGLPFWLAHGWMQIKLGFVILLTLFHAWCWRLVKDFARNEINHGHRWFRWFNEFPTVVLIAVVLLVILKPF